MNELLELLGLVDEAKKAQAQQLVDAIKLKIAELDNKIVEQERLKLDAINSRDEIKTKLKKVSTELGVEAENVLEAIEAIKTKKGGADNDVKDREITQLKNEIEQLTNTLNETKQSTTKEMLKMTLANEVAISLPKYNAKKNGYGYIIGEVEKKASFEDGKIMFKNSDGTTLRIDGRDATVDDVIKSMFEAEKKSNESMFFNIEVQSSGASNMNGGGKVVQDFIP
ncbi:MAG: hypothetical protein RBR93_09050 [Aliarcobacter butzleri]|nr:hypothetical protein [Aliarcobacter butzleri]